MNRCPRQRPQSTSTMNQPAEVQTGREATNQSTLQTPAKVRQFAAYQAMPVCLSAMRHSTEFPANAIIVRIVRIQIRDDDIKLPICNFFWLNFSQWAVLPQRHFFTDSIGNFLIHPEEPPRGLCISIPRHQRIRQPTVSAAQYSGNSVRVSCSTCSCDGVTCLFQLLNIVAPLKLKLFSGIG